MFLYFFKVSVPLVLYNTISPQREVNIIVGNITVTIFAQFFSSPPNFTVLYIPLLCSFTDSYFQFLLSSLSTFPLPFEKYYFTLIKERFNCQQAILMKMKDTITL